MRYSQQQGSPGLMQSPIRRRVRVLHFVQRHQPRARRAATFGAGSKKSKGGSAQTWQGMLAYLDGHRPSLVFWENADGSEAVATDSKAAQSNVDIVLADLASRGYEAQKCTVNSVSFGLPQSRQRVLSSTFWLWQALCCRSSTGALTLSSRPSDP